MCVSSSLLPSALLGIVPGWAGGDTRSVKDFEGALAVATKDDDDDDDDDDDGDDDHDGDDDDDDDDDDDEIGRAHV